MDIYNQFYPHIEIIKMVRKPLKEGILFGGIFVYEWVDYVKEPIKY